MCKKIRNAFPLFALAMALSACASDAPVDAKPGAPMTQTITLNHAKAARIGAEDMTIELVAVKDDRCPMEARCIWAGHAAVTLKISKGGAIAQTLTIGTQAPADMKLAGDADYGNYRLHLDNLEPANSTKGRKLAEYRATITLTPRQ